MARDKLIRARVDADEHEAAKRACDARGTTISEEIRAFMARLAKRTMKQEAAK